VITAERYILECGIDSFTKPCDSRCSDRLARGCGTTSAVPDGTRFARNSFASTCVCVGRRCGLPLQCALVYSPQARWLDIRPRIEVEIAYDPSHLRLRIRDDGSGIDPKIIEAGGKPGHWGMRGMRERAAKIGAHLETWSRPGAGTELELRIPGSVAYNAQGNGSLWRTLRQLWHEEMPDDADQSSNR
jgi:hypothetical protein